MHRHRTVVVLALCAVLGYVNRSYAGCKGSAGTTGAGEQQLRAILSDASDEGEFHVLSEAIDATGRWKFVLYLNNTAGEPTNSMSVYVAGITGNMVGKSEKAAFIYNVSRYLQQLESQLTKSSENHAQQVRLQSPIVDGCLNTLQLPESTQGLHLNLFLKDPQSGSSGATDALFAVREHSLIQPVLELNETSMVQMRASRRVMHQDSTIWMRQTEGNVVEVIWEQFNRTAAGIMTADYTQNLMYQWKETGFRRIGTLQPNQLAEHLKGALALTRCSVIIPLRFKVEEMRPNQPAP